MSCKTCFSDPINLFCTFPAGQKFFRFKDQSKDDGVESSFGAITAEAAGEFWGESCDRERVRGNMRVNITILNGLISPAGGAFFCRL